METMTSAISVQVDSYDKEVVNNILKNLGLNMSTFVNMAIKQLIYMTPKQKIKQRHHMLIIIAF